MLVAPVLLLLAGAAGVQARESPLPPRAQEVRGRVDRILEDWRGHPEKHPTEKLAQELASLGGAAAGYLGELLDSQRATAPTEGLAMALGRIGGSAVVPPLARLCRSSVDTERIAAIRGLRLVKLPESVAAIVPALDDAALDVALEAEEALVSSGVRAAEIVECVRRELQKAKDPTRFACVLGRVGGEEAHSVLIGLLGSRGDEKKIAAMQGLWLLGLGEDGEAVLGVLRDATSEPVLKQASQLLGRLRYRRAVPSLIRLLRFEDPAVVSSAHWALCRIADLNLKPDPSLWQQWWELEGRND